LCVATEKLASYAATRILAIEASPSAQKAKEPTQEGWDDFAGQNDFEDFSDF
jgi:hypothetical protein